MLSYLKKWSFLKDVETEIQKNKKREEFRWKHKHNQDWIEVCLCSIAPGMLKIEDALEECRHGGNEFNISMPSTETQMQDNINFLKNMLP